MADPTPSAKAERELPVSFASFLVSLASSAMLHMGEAPDPTTGLRETHLERARHSIDLLGVFKEKTKGNLDADEEKLLDTLLYETRQSYLAKAKGA